MRKKIEKASLQELADYLGVSLSAVKQYDKKKKLLMLIGLKTLNQDKEKVSNR